MRSTIFTFFPSLLFILFFNCKKKNNKKKKKNTSTKVDSIKTDSTKNMSE